MQQHKNAVIERKKAGKKSHVKDITQSSAKEIMFNVEER
jgi:hypothetical protein